MIRVLVIDDHEVFAETMVRLLAHSASELSRRCSERLTGGRSGNAE